MHHPICRMTNILFVMWIQSLAMICYFLPFVNGWFIFMVLFSVSMWGQQMRCAHTETQIHKYRYILYMNAIVPHRYFVDLDAMWCGAGRSSVLRYDLVWFRTHKSLYLNHAIRNDCFCLLRSFIWPIDYHFDDHDELCH